MLNADYWRSEIAKVRFYARRLAPHKHQPYAKLMRRWYAKQLIYARRRLRGEVIELPEAKTCQT